MAEIYVIYGRQDEDRAKRLVELLSRRWTVWWDKYVKQHFVDEIHQELPVAKCALVLWSATSRVKDTVVDEVRLAQKHHVLVSISQAR